MPNKKYLWYKQTVNDELYRSSELYYIIYIYIYTMVLFIHLHLFDQNSLALMSRNGHAQRCLHHALALSQFILLPHFPVSEVRHAVFEHTHGPVRPAFRHHPPVDGILSLGVQVVEECGGDDGDDVSKEHEAHVDTV